MYIYNLLNLLLHTKQLALNVLNKTLKVFRGVRHDNRKFF